MTKLPSTQDTPGRAKPSSSRQQIAPDQGTQTGAADLDRRSAGRSDKVKYKDRPGDEGKHGDGDQEPNSGFPER